MKAQADPTKINNKPASASHNGRASVATVMKQAHKGPGSAASSSSSALASSLDHPKIRELYSDFETGKLTAAKFRQVLGTEMGIRVNPQFERVLGDPTRNYHKVIKTFEVPQKTATSPEYFTSAQSQKVISSTSLTTLAGAPRTRAEIDEVRSLAQSYATGSISANQFQASLTEKGIPISNELQRQLNQHEMTKSVSYQSLAKTILGSASPQKFSAKPEQVNPTVYKPIPSVSKVQTDAVSKHKSKVEMVNREYDKIGNGVYATHKKRAEPQIKDNGELWTWDADAKLEPARNKNQVHLEHHDIFHWQRRDITDSKVTRKFPATQRAAQNSGNIVTWQ